MYARRHFIQHKELNPFNISPPPKVINQQKLLENLLMDTVCQVAVGLDRRSCIYIGVVHGLGGEYRNGRD